MVAFVLLIPAYPSIGFQSLQDEGVEFCTDLVLLFNQLPIVLL